MTAISSTQVKNNTEESIISSSGALINEMGYAIENFLGQYEKGLAQFRLQPPSELLEVGGDNSEPSLTALNTLSITLIRSYEDCIGGLFFTPINKQSLCLISDLGTDFDPTTREWYSKRCSILTLFNGQIPISTKQQANLSSALQ